MRLEASVSSRASGIVTRMRVATATRPAAAPARAMLRVMNNSTLKAMMTETDLSAWLMPAR